MLINLSRKTDLVKQVWELTPGPNKSVPKLRYDDHVRYKLFFCYSHFIAQKHSLTIKGKPVWKISLGLPSTPALQPMSWCKRLEALIWDNALMAQAFVGIGEDTTI